MAANRRKSVFSLRKQGVSINDQYKINENNNENIIANDPNTTWFLLDVNNIK